MITSRGRSSIEAGPAASLPANADAGAGEGDLTLQERQPTCAYTVNEAPGTTCDTRYSTKELTQ